MPNAIYWHKIIPKITTIVEFLGESPLDSTPANLGKV